MKKAKGEEEEQQARQAGREPLEQQAFFDVQSWGLGAFGPGSKSLHAILEWRPKAGQNLKTDEYWKLQSLFLNIWSL